MERFSCDDVWQCRGGAGAAGCQGGCECQGLHRPHGADVSVGGRPRRGGETSQAGRGQGIALIEYNSFKGESIIALSLID